MFHIGEFVVNTNNGICEINDIVTMNMSGSDKEYYLLVPIAEQTAKVYIPVDMSSQRIRLAMSKKDALELLKVSKTLMKHISKMKKKEKKLTRKP